MLIEDYNQAHEIVIRTRIIRKLRKKFKVLIHTHMTTYRNLAEQEQLKNTQQFIDDQETKLNQLLEDHLNQVATELKEEFKAI